MKKILLDLLKIFLLKINPAILKYKRLTSYIKRNKSNIIIVLVTGLIISIFVDIHLKYKGETTISIGHNLNRVAHLVEGMCGQRECKDDTVCCTSFGMYYCTKSDQCVASKTRLTAEMCSNFCTNKCSNYFTKIFCYPSCIAGCKVDDRHENEIRRVSIFKRIGMFIFRAVTYY